MEKIDITIIGAGVVGLAIATKLSQLGREIIVVEKESSFGQHTSSRNSEVIHTGIYYPKDSLKAKLCVEGNRLLYEICNKYNINHKKLGKLIVATDEEEIKVIEKLLKKGRDNGVENLEIIDNSEIKKIEPNVYALAAVYSPNTGIIDTHNLMKYFAQVAQDAGVIISYDSEVSHIEKKNGYYKVQVVRDNYTFESKIVINCAGLYSDKISRLVGLNDYKLYYAKGNYFFYTGESLIKRLVYPPPEESIKSLGLHSMLDLGGRMKFGPDITYVKEINYEVEVTKKEVFYNSVKKYLPRVEFDKMLPDMAGIRPKLQGPDDPEVKDFIIRHEVDKGFPNFINLVGIESPGLTASPAIANYVFNLVKECL